MLWAIVSSAFVIYLYRTLNAAVDTGTADGVIPADAIETELAKLNSRLDAIESMIGGKARRTTP